jgi:hypothetical protein
MAIQIQGNGGTVAEVDGTTWRALRVTARPVDHGSLGYYRISMTSGTMAAALGANSEIFQFRWPDATRFSIVQNIAVSAGINVVATAAGLASFRATIARSWTAAGSGGTRATMTGNNQKLRTSMGTSLVNDIGCSTTAALTAGTKTLDSQDIGAVATGIGTGALTVASVHSIIPKTMLYDMYCGERHPVVFAQNEGFVIRIGAAMPATMTWHFQAECEWGEVAAY